MEYCEDMLPKTIDIELHFRYPDRTRWNGPRSVLACEAAHGRDRMESREIWKIDRSSTLLLEICPFARAEIHSTMLAPCYEHLS